MTNDKLFRKKLSELIEWYDPEFKHSEKTAKDILKSLKETIENSNCLTCGESHESDEASEDEISKKLKEKRVPKMWRCDYCNVTCSIKNKLNHERTNKHKNNVESKNDLLSTSSSDESE